MDNIFIHRVLRRPPPRIPCSFTVHSEATRNAGASQDSVSLLVKEMQIMSDSQFQYTSNTCSLKIPPLTLKIRHKVSRSEHIFMELTLFVYNINSQYFCIKSGLNYLRYKRYKRNETGGHIFFCNLNFHRNGIYILYIDCYHHRKIYILHWLVVSLYIEHFWTIIYHINTFKSYFHEIFCKSWFIFGIHKANVFV